MATRLEHTDPPDTDDEEERALEERLRAAGVRLPTGTFEMSWTPVKKRSRLVAFFVRLLRPRE